MTEPRRPARATPSAHNNNGSRPPKRSRQSSRSESAATETATAGRSAEVARRLVLDRFAPVSLLVTSNGDSVHLCGDVERLLPCVKGTSERDRLRRAQGVLAERVREVLAASARNVDARVVGSFGADVPAGVRSVRLTVIPVPGVDAAHRPARLLVLEEEHAAVAPPQQRNDGGPAIATRSATAMAPGVTLAEDEEFGALHAMLQAKAVELRNAHADLANLLGSMRDATICLDRHLRLKWFNDAASLLLGLESIDRGRSIQELARRFGDEGLCEDARKVLRSLTPVEREQTGSNGRRYFRRVRPYRVDLDLVDGVMVTFAEARDEAGEETVLRARAERLEHAVAMRMRDLDLLHRCIDAANHCSTLRDTLVLTCRLLCEHGGWSLGRTVLAGREGSESFMDSGAGWPDGGECEQLIAEWCDVPFGADGDPLGAVLHGGAPTWIADLAGAPAAHWIDTARRAGFRCALLVPIRAGQRVSGAFLLLAEEAPQPDEAALKLLTLVGSTAARVIERERFSRRLTELADEERLRIAQELHDGLGQELAGLGLLTASLVRDMRERDPDSSGRIASIDHEVGALTAHVRALTTGLFPAELQADELPRALAELCSRFSRLSGVDCHFDSPEGTPPLDDTAATQLHGIAQEAVRNAVQYGQASRVRVRLHGTDRVVLQVADDGIGMDVTRRPTGGGLRIMRHRADLIGGTLTFESSDRGGVIVTCSVARRATPPAHGPGARDGITHGR